MVCKNMGIESLLFLPWLFTRLYACFVKVKGQCKKVYLIESYQQKVFLIDWYQQKVYLIDWYLQKGGSFYLAASRQQNESQWWKKKSSAGKPKLIRRVLVAFSVGLFRSTDWFRFTGWVRSTEWFRSRSRLTFTDRSSCCGRVKLHHDPKALGTSSVSSRPAAPVPRDSIFGRLGDGAEHVVVRW